MARLSSVGQNVHIRNQLDNIKMQHALDWLRENPTEKLTTAARLHFITNEQSVQQAWRCEKKRNERLGKAVGGGGWNRILRPDQHQAMI